MVETSMSETQTSPIRVLHLIDGLGGGGSERWIWDIVRLSDARRVRHFVVTMYPDTGGFVYATRLRAVGAYGNRPKSPVLPGIARYFRQRENTLLLYPLRKLQSLTWHFGRQASAFIDVARALAQFRPHVIHVHTFHGFSPGVFLKSLLHLPLVHTVPALFTQMREAGFGWMPRRYAWFHRKVDRFVTGASVSDLHGIGIPPSKIVPIQGVVEVEAVLAIAANRELYYRTVREELKIAPDSLILLSVGRLHPSKGHEYALEALPKVRARFSQVEWLVLGEGGQRDVLVQRARELGVQAHVHLMGFHDAPLRYYAAADVYLRTPIYEAENLSSYHAMAIGLPVVGFNTRCETELLEKVGHGILVPKGDSAKLAEEIIEILSLSDKGQKIGRRGAEYAQKYLDIHQTISSYMDIYQALCSSLQRAARIV